MAEGEREASVLRADGFAMALKAIDAAAKEIDSKTMTLQYLEALKELGASDGTKLVIPTELTSMAQPLLAHAIKAHAEPAAAE